MGITVSLMMVVFRSAFVTAVFFCIFSILSRMPSLPSTETLGVRYAMMWGIFLGLLLWITRLRGDEFLRRVTHLKLALWSWPQAVAIGFPLAVGLFLAPHYCLLMLILATEIILVTIGGCLRSVSAPAVPTAEVDCLDRQHYVDLLHDGLWPSDDPSKSGNNGCASFLFGRNGLGKTFVLGMLAQKILTAKGMPETRLVRFNPWKYRSEHDVIVGFFKSITDTLSQDYFIHDLNGFPGEFVALMDSAKSQISFLNIFTPFFAMFGAKQDFDSLSKTVKQYADLLKIKVVVFVDDLDRCSPEIRKVLFQLLNHKDTQDLQSCVHVVIAASAEELFAPGAVGMTKTEVALERYIRHAVHLPKMTDSQKYEIFKKYCDNWGFDDSRHPSKDIKYWNDNRNDLLIPIFNLLETPRQVTSFCERVSRKVAHGVVMNWFCLLAATAIETSRPDLHEWIIRNWTLMDPPNRDSAGFEKLLEDNKMLFTPDSASTPLFTLLFFRSHVTDSTYKSSILFKAFLHNCIFDICKKPVFDSFYSLIRLPDLITYRGWKEQILDVINGSTPTALDVDETIEKRLDLFVQEHGVDPNMLEYLRYWISTTFEEKKGTIDGRIALYFGLLKGYSRYKNDTTSNLFSEEFQSFTNQLFLSIVSQDLDKEDQRVVGNLLLRTMKTPGLHVAVYGKTLWPLYGKRNVYTPSNQPTWDRFLKTVYGDRKSELARLFIEKFREYWKSPVIAGKLSVFDSDSMQWLGYLFDWNEDEFCNCLYSLFQQKPTELKHVLAERINPNMSNLVELIGDPFYDWLDDPTIAAMIENDPEFIKYKDTFLNNYPRQPNAAG